MLLPARLFLAVLSAGMLFSVLLARPTIEITKDAGGFRLWHCNETIATNAKDVPLKTVKFLAENILDGTGINSAEQSDTTTGKPTGFAGLERNKSINSRTITFIGDAMAETPGDSVDATPWNIGPIQKVTNVPMLVVFIFGLLLALLVALRRAAIIRPRMFVACTFSVVGFLIGLLIIGGALKIMSIFFPIPTWATLAGLAIGGITGLIIGVFKTPNQPSMESVSKQVINASYFGLVVFIGLSWFGSWRGFSTMTVVVIAIFVISWGLSKLIKRPPRKPATRQTPPPPPPPAQE